MIPVKASTATTNEIFQGMNTGNMTNYVTSSNKCTVAGNNKFVNFTLAGNQNLKSLINSGQGYITLGMRAADETQSATRHEMYLDISGAAVPYPTLVIKYTPMTTYPVTDLTYTFIGDTYVDLSWTALPYVTGYMLNYTTPWAEPLTKINNDTGTTIHTYTVAGLTRETPYSFRASGWSLLGTNDTGNILNITTVKFVPANFTIGNLDFNATNPTRIGIRFERTDVNDTVSNVNVIFSNDYILDCTMKFRYAMQTNNYTGISGTPYNLDENINTFVFVNATNDIVNIVCVDETTRDTGRYVLTQNDFLLKQQIRDFRNGTYGTSGELGVLDLTTVIIFIFAMIGFNRTNPAVGIVMCLIAVGALWYFEVITIPGAFLSAITIITIVAIGSTRKDE